MFENYNKMESLEKRFIDIIKKCDKGLVYDIDVSYSNYDGDDVYCELSYQIDDRIDNRGSDNNVRLLIKNELGDSFGVSVDRMDAFPNGYDSYKVTIDQ